MNRKKIFVLLSFFFFFVLGFLVHAIFFPSLLTDNYLLTVKHKITNKKPPKIDNQNKALTLVIYEDGEFDPKVVVMGKSYYLGIVNNSDTELMTLTSSDPRFRTVRAYGKSEEQLVQIYEVGTYEVSSEEHPNSFLKVIVK